MSRLLTIGLLATLASVSVTAQTPPSRPSPVRIVCTSCRWPPAELGSAAFPPRTTLLGQHKDIIEPQIARQAGAKPVIIQTPRATLVAALDAGGVDQLAPEEVDYLRSTFPALGPAVPASLDGHQQAHLLAYRMLRIENDVRDLLDLDAGGRVKPESSPHRPLASGQVEVFVFGSKAGFESFNAFLFARDVWPLGGTMLESGPTSAMLMPSMKDPSARRQFAFSVAMQLLRGLSRAGSGLQGWLHVGLAHVVEDRHAGKGARTQPGATLPPGSEAPKDWDAFVADLVTAGKVGDLGALAATPANALSVRSRLQAWSHVRWMLEKDPKSFTRMVRLLLHESPAEAPTKALLGAVRPTFNHDLVSLVDEWKQWVKKERASK